MHRLIGCVLALLAPAAMAQTTVDARRVMVGSTPLPTVLDQIPNVPLERLDATIDMTGATDGTAKLSAALLAATTAYPGRCVYQASSTTIRLDAAILIPTNACFIMGPGSKLLRTASGTGSRMVRIASGARVEGMTLDGGGTGTAVSGIVNEGDSVAVLRSITIRNMSGKAVAVNGAVDWTVDGLDVSGNTVALQTVSFYNNADIGFSRVRITGFKSDRSAASPSSVAFGASALQVNGTPAHPTLVYIDGADFREPYSPPNAYQALGTVNAYGNISNISVLGGSIAISLSKPTSDNLNVSQVSGRGQNLKVIEVPGDCINGGCVSTSDLGGGYINLSNINADGAGLDGVVRLPRGIAVDTTGSGINIANVVCRRYIQDCISAFNGKNSLNISNVYADGGSQTGAFAPTNGQGAVNIAASSGQPASRWVNIANVQCRMGGVGTRCLFFRNAQYVNARNVIVEGLASGGKIVEIIGLGAGQTADFYDLDVSDGGNSPTSAMAALSASTGGALGSSIRIRGRGFAPYVAGWTCDLIDAAAGLGRCDGTVSPEGVLDGAKGSRALNRTTGIEYVKTTAKATLTGWSAIVTP